MTFQPVPYIFNTRTSPIPLSELDENLRYVSDKVFYIRDFYYGSGVTDDQAFDLAAVQLAAEGGTLVLEPNVTYNLWASGARVIFQLNNHRPVKIQGNGATIQSVAPSNPSNCFLIISQDNGQGVWVENLTFRGTTNTSLPVNPSGEHFINFATASKNIYVNNCRVFNCNAGVQCTAEDTVNENVVVTNCYFERVMYPLSFWATRNVFANVRTKECGRSYFPVSIGGFNCENHDITVYSESGYTSADCLLWVSCRTGVVSRMSNISINYTSPGRAPGAGAMSDGMVYLDLRQENAANGVGMFENIQVNFCVNGADSSGALANPPANIVQLVKRLDNGAGDPTPRGHIVNGVSIRGTARNWNNSNANGIILCDTLGGAANWTGDFITGLAVRDVIIGGIPSLTNTFVVNGQGAIATTPFLTLENVYAEGNISYANTTNANVSETNVKMGNLDALSSNIPKSYAAVLSNSAGGLVMGNTTMLGTQQTNGRNVHVDGVIAFDTGGGWNPGGAGVFEITLPFNISATTPGPIGSCVLTDASGNHYPGVAYGHSLNKMWFYVDVASGPWQPGGPIVIATGDSFRWSLDYIRVP